MESKDLVALNDLTNEILEAEQSLVKQEEQYALASKEFASYLEQRKRQQDELDVLKAELKNYMVEHEIMEHDTGSVMLKLSSTGKFSCEDIEQVPEECVKVVKQLDNKAVKAYEQLNGKLPEGVEPQGYRLTMKIKEN